LVIMNKELLVDKVAKLLGVSSTEKEFAFQIFIEKTADVLGLKEALKFSNLGFFYLKSDAGVNAFTDTLLYVPIQDEANPFEDSFFLSFDVKKKNRDALEFDSSVFSLSIEKSTLPFEKDSAANTDISYHLLKKTIEERVEDLISGAMHLENFQMADSLIGDRHAESILEVEEEQVTSEQDQSYEEMIFSRMNLNESLSALSFEEEKEILSEPPAPVNLDLDKEILSYIEEEVIEESLPENEPGIKEEDVLNFIENDDKIPDSVFFEEQLEEKKENPIVDKKDVENNSEWKWSENLNAVDEEAVHTEEENNDFYLPPTEEQLVETPGTADSKNLFMELETTMTALEKEEELPAEEKFTLNAPLPVQEEPAITMMEKAMKEENENIPEEENNYIPEEEDNSKRNIILVGFLIIIVLLAAYILFFHGFGIIKKKELQPPAVKSDSSMVQKQDTSGSGFKPQLLPETKDKQSAPVDSKAKQQPQEDKTQKLKESQAGDLMKEMKNDSKVGSNIFTDGKTFYVQMSSWKNIGKAEQEVKKLRAKGEKAFMVKAYIEEFKGTWYRVRVGDFKSREEAEAYSKKHRE